MFTDFEIIEAVSRHVAAMGNMPQSKKLKLMNDLTDKYLSCDLDTLNEFMDEWWRPPAPKPDTFIIKFEPKYL